MSEIPPTKTTLKAEYELNEPPTDGISSLHFHPTGANQLLCTSWDKSVRLYDTKANRCIYTHQSDAAVLDGCFTGSRTGASGGLDMKVRTHDFEHPSMSRELGRHGAAVKSLLHSADTNVLVSGSWDKTVKLWDTRQPTPLISTLEQPDKVYAMSMAGTKVVVACANRHIMIWDLRMALQSPGSPQMPEQRRESSLKFQTRTVECNPDATGYILASIEGRVAVEFLDVRPEVQARKYAFKCHRIKNPDGKPESTYPVNAVAYHPKYGTFATGGSDGFVNVWDGDNKKRICQLRRYKTSIAALSFNCTGDTLAIARSYTYESGPREHPPDAIFIRTITDAEAKPK